MTIPWVTQLATRGWDSGPGRGFAFFPMVYDGVFLRVGGVFVSRGSLLSGLTLAIRGDTPFYRGWKAGGRYLCATEVVRYCRRKVRARILSQSIMRSLCQGGVGWV